MAGGILFFVIESMSNKPSNSNLAQLFLELLCASSSPWSMCTCTEHHTATAKANKQADLEGLRVYGILTNLNRYSFYSYDPISNKFCQDDEIFVGTLRDGFLSDMIYGMCLISWKFLEAHAAKSQLPIKFLALYYLPSLRGYVRKSKRASKGLQKEMLVALLIIFIRRD